MGFFFLITFKIYFDKLEKIKNHEMRSSLGFMLVMSQRIGFIKLHLSTTAFNITIIQNGFIIILKI
jgi:hypothetical protein